MVGITKMKSIIEENSERNILKTPIFVDGQILHQMVMKSMHLMSGVMIFYFVASSLIIQTSALPCRI